MNNAHSIRVSVMPALASFRCIGATTSVVLKAKSRRNQKFCHKTIPPISLYRQLHIITKRTKSKQKGELMEIKIIISPDEVIELMKKSKSAGTEMDNATLKLLQDITKKCIIKAINEEECEDATLIL